MSKKTLQQKINCVKWSAAIFAIGYFLIGVCLTKTGSNLDTKKAYDLLTTSLTLTAYFLGPIAAFLLFSDWREQHNKSVNANFFLKIYEGYFEYRFKINLVMSRINKLLSDGYTTNDLKSALSIFNDASDRMIQIMSDICEVVSREDYERDFFPLITDLQTKFKTIENLIELLIDLDGSIDKELQICLLKEQFSGRDENLYKHMKSFLFHAREYYKA